MKTFALILLLCAAPAFAQQKTATVTFFREKSASAFKQMYQYKIDYAAPGIAWNIYMDGMKLVTLHRERMVTFAIPAGHHDFKIDRTVMVPVDVEAGASLFFRPGMQRSKNKLEAVYNFKLVSCVDYLNRTKGIKLVDPKDIFTGTVVPEKTFSRICQSTQKDGL